MEDPTALTVTAYFDAGIHQVDELVEYALRREEDIVRIVLRWDGERVRLAYAVRWDATPVLVDDGLIPPLPEEWRRHN